MNVLSINLTNEKPDAAFAQRRAGLEATTMPIIQRTAQASTQPGILHLPTALAQNPTQDIVVYARVSSRGQAKRGALDEQAHKEFSAIRDIAGSGKVRALISGVELGQLSANRRHLQRAIDAARKWKAILCARDLSRFIRAEAYNRRTNIDAEPTPVELSNLFEMATGVVLATRQPPTLTEAERHSEATKGKCGRPAKIDYRTGLRILQMFEEEPMHDADHNSCAHIAQQLGLSKSVVQRFLAQPSDRGNAWRDYERPSYVYASQHKRKQTQGTAGPRS